MAIYLNGLPWSIGRFKRFTPAPSQKRQIHTNTCILIGRLCPFTSELGLARNTVYIRYFWQGKYQIYGHIQCTYTVLLAGELPNIRSYTVHIHGSFGREITKYMVIYGVYTVFLAGRLPSIRSYTVYLYGTFGREITKYTVIYGVYTVFLAGRLPSIRSYTVYLYGSGQAYSKSIHTQHPRDLQHPFLRKDIRRHRRIYFHI